MSSSCSRRSSKVSRSSGHLIIGSAVQHTTREILAHTTPLLEEEGNTVRTALSTYRLHPERFYLARSWSRFPANDHPIDILEWQIVERADQGLT